MRSAPQKALDFAVFDAFKALGLQTFVAAAAAGATSNAVLYPLEVQQRYLRLVITTYLMAAATRSSASRLNHQNELPTRVQGTCAGCQDASHRRQGRALQRHREHLLANRAAGGCSGPVPRTAALGGRHHPRSRDHVRAMRHILCWHC